MENNTQLLLKVYVNPIKDGAVEITHKVRMFDELLEKLNGRDVKVNNSDIFNSFFYRSTINPEQSISWIKAKRCKIEEFCEVMNKIEKFKIEPRVLEINDLESVVINTKDNGEMYFCVHKSMLKEIALN